MENFSKETFFGPKWLELHETWKKWVFGEQFFFSVVYFNNNNNDRVGFHHKKKPCMELINIINMVMVYTNALFGQLTSLYPIVIITHVLCLYLSIYLSDQSKIIRIQKPKNSVPIIEPATSKFNQNWTTFCMIPPILQAKPLGRLATNFHSLPTTTPAAYMMNSTRFWSQSNLYLYNYNLFCSAGYTTRVILSCHDPSSYKWSMKKRPFIEISITMPVVNYYAAANEIKWEK